MLIIIMSDNCKLPAYPTYDSCAREIVRPNGWALISVPCGPEMEIKITDTV